MIEAEGHSLLAGFADRRPSRSVDDYRLQQQLETAVEEDQDRFCPSPIPRSIEMVDSEHQRVHRLGMERPAFLPHGHEPYRVSNIRPRQRSSVTPFAPSFRSLGKHARLHDRDA